MHAQTAGSGSTSSAPEKVGLNAWLIFGLTFILLLSDYMSRQVLNAVFPLLKSEWMLSDGRLGALGGVVSLTVGVLSFPVAFLSDRLGRIRSLVLMAFLWSLATLGCGLAQSYDQLLVARFGVGLGEAGYGSVGLAVILSAFPARWRATLTGAFMAGGMVGSVLGIALGGAIAAHFGWRIAFQAFAAFGLCFGLIYLIFVREKETGESAHGVVPPSRTWANLRHILTDPTLLMLYAASGLQLFITGALLAWIPSFLGRYYGFPTAKAAGVAAVLVLVSGAGMALCGFVSDRWGRSAPGSGRQISLAIGFCVVSGFVLLAAFQLSPGPAQLVCIGAGMLLAAGTTGPTGAMVAQMAHRSVLATAFATLTLGNNLLGLGPGPFLTGVLADHVGLAGALGRVPLVAFAAAALYWGALARHRRSESRPRASSNVMASGALLK